MCSPGTVPTHSVVIESARALVGRGEYGGRSSRSACGSFDPAHPVTLPVAIRASRPGGLAGVNAALTLGF
jgi:hypothetical protein